MRREASTPRPGWQHKLEQLGFIMMLDSERLDPMLLAAEIERCLALPRTAPAHSIDLRGAEKTAQLLTDLLEERSS